MTSAAGWKPTTEAEIDQSIRTGDLKENRHLDVKREVGSGDSSRKETARDIASLAISGGVLLIGVDEPTKDQFSLAPIDLTGEAERLEQIAANRIDPPVLVTTREIASATAPGKGYLWVEVPPSSLAPHMVDGVYWGRADKTKARLTDAQVLLLHSRRESHDARIGLLLDEEVERDPIPKARRLSGHLHMVAWPVQARDDAALSVFKVQDPHPLLSPILGIAEEGLDPRTREIAPGPGYAGVLKRRAHGIAFTSLGGAYLRSREDSQSAEQTAVDVEFREDGGIRVFMGRMTMVMDPGPDSIADGLAVAYVRRLLRWAAEYGSLWGYTGAWGFGVEAAGLNGLSSSAHHHYDWYRPRNGVMRQHHIDGPAYDRESYRAIATASSQDLLHQPWTVADRLVGRLVRGLGTETYYAADLNPPASAPSP